MYLFIQYRSHEIEIHHYQILTALYRLQCLDPHWFYLSLQFFCLFLQRFDCSGKLCCGHCSNILNACDSIDYRFHVQIFCCLNIPVADRIFSYNAQFLSFLKFSSQFRVFILNTFHRGTCLKTSGNRRRKPQIPVAFASFI